MQTIDTYLKSAKFVRDSLLDETERIIYAKENEIANLNIGQIEESKGSDGKLLENSDTRFKGVYTLSTQLLNPKKIAGTPYDFFETGNFLRGFQVDIDSTLTKISITSTGTGGGEKASFFRGYTNLFGLDVQNQSKLNYSIILPELQNFINKYL